MTELIFTDEYFMKEALKEARKAFNMEEVPVGAVIVSEKQIIARSHNLVETLNDATAHAEIMAITAAENFLGSKYLNECILYVTLEPCIMCAGAIELSKLGSLVFGARDHQKGYQKIAKSALHSSTRVKKQLMEEECGKLLTDFFSRKR